MSNNRTALGLSLIVLTMITLVAFSVPLYDLFCRVTGYGGVKLVHQNFYPQQYLKEI